MKAVLGWAMHDLVTAARLLASRPAGYWEREDRRPTADCLRRTIREACGFLREVGEFDNPVTDYLGNRFWFDREGNLARWELAGEGRRS